MKILHQEFSLCDLAKGENNICSLKKEGKELTMDRLKEKRLLEALEKLKKSVVKRSILLSAKFNERLGIIKQKYPGASNWFDISCKTTEDGLKATDLVWTKKELGRQRTVFAGCHVIETNKAGIEAVDICRAMGTGTVNGL